MKHHKTRKTVIHQLRRRKGMITGRYGSKLDCDQNQKPELKSQDQCRIARTESEGKKFGNNLQPAVGDGFEVDEPLLAENGC